MLAFIKRLQPPTDISAKKVIFGEITRHKTLIFDLDETLIQSSQCHEESHLESGDFRIKVAPEMFFNVAVRPYLYECLDRLSQYYELSVFTAAEQRYADLIIDKIDPDKKYFGTRLYRQHCVEVESPLDGSKMYIKDLRIIEDRDREDILIVDNSILSFAFQLDNGVPICSYYGGNRHSDQELLYLVTYLEEVFHQKDTQAANKRMFKLSELMSNS